MGYGLWKSHHGYMKATALREHSALVAFCNENGIEPIIPKRKHWHGIENASALMLEKMTPEQRELLPKFIRQGELFSILSEAKKEFKLI